MSIDFSNWLLGVLAAARVNAVTNKEENPTR